jgi:hypothetical protein
MGSKLNQNKRQFTGGLLLSSAVVVIGHMDELRMGHGFFSG